MKANKISIRQSSFGWGIVSGLVIVSFGVIWELTRAINVETELKQTAAKLASTENQIALQSLAAAAKAQYVAHKDLTASEVFESQGWKMIENPSPPDADVLNLDDRLIGTAREGELLVQLRSSTLHPTQLTHAKSLILHSQGHKTIQLDALEALERSNLAQAQVVLTELYAEWPDRKSRDEQILMRIHPKTWDDASGKFLREQLSTRALSETFESKVLAQLALVALASRTIPGSRSIASLAQDLPMDLRQQFLLTAKNLNSNQ